MSLLFHSWTSESASYTNCCTTESGTSFHSGTYAFISSTEYTSQFCWKLYVIELYTSSSFEVQNASEFFKTGFDTVVLLFAKYTVSSFTSTHWSGNTTFMDDPAQYSAAFLYHSANMFVLPVFASSISHTVSSFFSRIGFANDFICFSCFNTLL